MKPFTFICCLGMLYAVAVNAQIDNDFVHDISRHDRFITASLSEDGKYIAVIDYALGGYHLGLVNTETLSYRNDIIKDTVYVSQVEWYGNEQILIVDTKMDQSVYVYLYDIGADSYEVVFYYPAHRKNITAEIIHSDPGSVNSVVVRVGTRVPEFYIVDVIKKSRKEIKIGLDNINSLYLDNEGEPYAVTQINKTKYTVHIKREDDDTGWKPLLSGDIYAENDPLLLFIDPDGRTLWVSAYQDRDLRGVWKYDAYENTFDTKPVLVDNKYDIQAELLVNHARGEVAAIHYERNYPYTYYLDPRLDEIAKKISSVLTDGRIKIVDMAAEEKRYLITYESDKKPLQWYLFSDCQNKLILIGSHNNRLDKYEMYERIPVRYMSRDGFEVEAYMTLPESPVKGLVINPHGGPELRDVWGFDRLAQLLAHHGYAVIQPNFRGSTGYGRKFYEAAVKQYGLAMKNDLEDAVNWATRTYDIRSDKVCAVGGSYGAYASVNLLYSNPDLLNCAVGISGFYDAVQLLKDDEDKLFADVQKRRMGDPVLDLSMLSSISPINQVSASNGPVLLIHGRNDFRIDYHHSVRMHDKVMTVGGHSKLHIINSDGHSFHKQSSMKDMYLLILQFLHDNISKSPAK